MVLLGSTKAIEASRAFIIKCQEQWIVAIRTMRMSALDAQQEQDLWIWLWNFWGTGRFELAEDDFVLESENPRFVH